MADTNVTQNGRDADTTVPGVRPDVMAHMPDAPGDIRSPLSDELYPDDAYFDGV